ncbi:hypothetical protein ACFXTN_008534 [Malus domestica]
MNFRFIAADTLQKIIMLFASASGPTYPRNDSLEWMITIFSLSTVPNTLVMGISLLIAMYGHKIPESGKPHGAGGGTAVHHLVHSPPIPL